MAFSHIAENCYEKATVSQIALPTAPTLQFSAMWEKVGVTQTALLIPAI